jgi:hypothetical protein
VQADALTERPRVAPPGIEGRNGIACQTPLTAPTGVVQSKDLAYFDLNAPGVSSGDSLVTRFLRCGDSGLSVYDNRATVQWRFNVASGTPLTGGDWRIEPAAPFEVTLASQPAANTNRTVYAALQLGGGVEKVGASTKVRIDAPSAAASTSYVFATATALDLPPSLTRASVLVRPSAIVERDAAGVRHMSGSVSFSITGGRGNGYFQPTNSSGGSVRYGALVQFDVTTPLRVDTASMANGGMCQ